MQRTERQLLPILYNFVLNLFKQLVLNPILKTSCYILGPNAYFSLDHCDSTLPLSPAPSALGPTCHPLEISYQYNNHG